MKNILLLTTKDRHNILKGLFKSSTLEPGQLMFTSSMQECLQEAAGMAYHLLVIDIETTGIEGLTGLEKFKIKFPGITAIMILDRLDEDTIDHALRKGVQDFITTDELKSPFLHKKILIAKERDRQIRQLGSEKKYSEITASKYRLIAENAQDLICILKPGLIVSYISPSLKNILGFEKEELMNKSIFQVFCPEDIEQFPRGNNDGEKYHYRVKHKNGDYIWFETIIKAIKGVNGEKQILATSKDITKRKKLSILMGEMQHLAKVGGWEYNFDKNRMYATEEIVNIFNVPKDKKISFRQALSYFTVPSQRVIKREFRQALIYGKSWDLELSFINTKGQVCWVRTLGRPYSRNGKVFKIGGTLQDISERIKYEDLLHNKQMELKAFVENTPAAIAMFDRKMNYITASSRWYHDYNLNGQQVIGKNHYQLFPKIPDEWKAVHQKCMEGAIERREEDKYITRNGSIEWFKWEVRPWRDVDGSIGGIIILTEQITQRKLAEEAALAQQKRMKGIYQITSDIYGKLKERIARIIETATKSLGMEYGLLTKIDNGICEIIESYSPRGSYYQKRDGARPEVNFCKITYAEDAVVAISHMGNSRYRHHPSYKACKMESYIAVPIYAGGAKYGTLNFISSYPVEYFPQADKDFVQIIGQWIGGAIDRRNYKAELVLAKEKAEEGSRAKAHFLSTMSHEIRTPMNAVVGITHLLLESNPKPEQIRNLETLKFSANNLLSLINDILDFSKIEAGKIEIENISFSLTELIQGLNNMFMFKANEKNIILDVRMESSLPAKVKGDPIRLNQILSNLLSNAIKFTEVGGVVLSIDKIKEDQNTIELLFTVTDTGIGIEKNKTETIFDSFTQASANTTRKYGGTGLGLAISKQLTAMKKGKLTVESELGKGSVFKVQLPFIKSADAEDALPVTTGPKEENLKGLNVLLVEDNEVNQLVALQFLTKKQIITETARNGLTALEKIKNKSFDLVLMDLQMPEMDGYETARQIRAMKDPYFQSIPIIALTASTMSEVAGEVKAAGIDDYITKPFVPANFYEKISHYRNKTLHAKEETRQESGYDYQPKFEKLMEIAFGEKDFYLKLLNKMEEEFINFNHHFAESVKKRDTKKLSFIKHKLTSTLIILNMKDMISDIEKLRDILKLKQNRHEAKLLAEQITENAHQVAKEIQREVERFRMLHST